MRIKVTVMSLANARLSQPLREEVYVCVCVCVCVHIYMCVFIHAIMNKDLFVCVCVCVQCIVYLFTTYCVYMYNTHEYTHLHTPTGTRSTHAYAKRVHAHICMRT